MKRRKNIRSKIIMKVICVLALVLATVSTHGWALDICSDPTSYPPQNDYDQDGFLNGEECTGINIPPGCTTNCSKTFLKCAPTLPNDDPSRQYCMDPETKDLFVILEKDTVSLIPPVNPLEFVTNNTTNWGLGIILHFIEFLDTVSLRVTPTQMSTRIVEKYGSDPTPSSNVLGETPVIGSPNISVGSFIYPGRIKTHISDKCANAPTCKDNITGLDWKQNRDAFETRYIKHTLSHEAAHNLDLTVNEDRTVGRHYKSSISPYVLNQFVFTKTDKNTGNVTWYVGDDFTPQDQSGMELK